MENEKTLGFVPYHSVDIVEEFKKYISANKKSPIIVMNPVKSLNPNFVSKYNEKEIVDRIIALGGIVVFFEECPLIEYNSTNKLKFNRGYSSKNYKKFLESGNVKKYDSFILNEQQNVSSLECELTLSEFASKVNAFAVLIKPKKLLLCGEKFRYWSINQFNTETGFTIQYDIEEARLYLGLSLEKMLLFQGISKKVPRYFYLLNFIKSLPNEITFKVLMRISDYTNTSFESLTLLFKYFKIPLSYRLLKKNEEVLGNCHQMSFNILKGLPIPLIADQIDRGTFIYEDILLPIVRKQAGILLKNENLNLQKPIAKTIQILTCEEKESRELKMRYVTPIYPESIEVPPLKYLFLRNDYPALDLIRWKLAFWCISTRLDYEKTISQEFIIPYLCVWYLVENKVIAKFEGDSIFLAIMASRSKLDEKYQNWNHTSKISERAVQISLLYVNLCNDIKKVFCSIGLNDVENLSPFGGIVFLNIYQEMKEKSLEMRIKLCKMFNFDSNFLKRKISRSAVNIKKGKGKLLFSLLHFEPSTRTSQRLPTFEPRICPKFKRHQNKVTLVQELPISIKDKEISNQSAVTIFKLAKYTRKLDEKKERKLKIKSLPWTQMYVSEYNSHNPLCKEMW